LAMNFEMDEIQRALAGLARQILTDDVEASSTVRDPDSGREMGVLETPLWQHFASAGLFAAPLPEEVGGQGVGVLGQCALLIEIGAHAPVLPFWEVMAGASA